METAADGRAALPSYAFLPHPDMGMPGSMPDPEAPASSALATSHHRGPPSPKRRRIDRCQPLPAADAETTLSSEPYAPTWTHPFANPHQARHRSYSTPISVAYAHPPVLAPSPAGESSSQWHQSDPAACPDLASHQQQQPYFYQQASAETYNAQWPQNGAHHYATPQSTSARHSVSEHTASSAMPFFPPSTHPGTTPVLDHAGALNYADGEQLDGANYANSAALSRVCAKPQPSSFYFDDASMHLKNQSLPILDNLATQLIYTISKANFPQIQEMMRGDSSEESQAYKTLKNLFDQTRKVYSRETPFIDAIAIQMFQPTQQEIIRKANIATFISSILGAHDVSFFHLNEFYMETFVPLGHRLLKWQGAIYLELKTQTYISALMNSDGRPEEMLEELFPPDLDAQILTRHPDAPSLSPSEQDFIDRSRARKSYLLAEPTTKNSLKELAKKYQWTDFVREFTSCINKNVEGITNIPSRSQAALGTKVAAAAEVVNGQGVANGTGSGAIPAAQSLNVNGQSGAKSGSSESRKTAASASTIRQPWAKAEEDALLNGLERVNGPHWSQILALYGRGGSVSEVLKDRNQVQLKDKARNLKLWYLKTGKEVPHSLRGVTGELRKRGGARVKAALGVLDDEDQGGPRDGQEGEEGDQEATGKRGAKKKAKKT